MDSSAALVERLINSGPEEYQKAPEPAKSAIEKADELLWIQEQRVLLSGPEEWKKAPELVKSAADRFELARNVHSFGSSSLH